jgi:hypothetical protein
LIVADQVTLKNGDRLTGLVVRSDGKTLVLKTDLAGEVTIALADVTNLIDDKPVYVALGNGQTVLGLVTTKDESGEIKASSGSVTINRGDVRAIRSEAEQKVYESTLNPGGLSNGQEALILGSRLPEGTRTRPTWPWVLRWPAKPDVIRRVSTLLEFTIEKKLQVSRARSQTPFVSAAGMIETSTANGSATDLLTLSAMDSRA